MMTNNKSSRCNRNYSSDVAWCDYCQRDVKGTSESDGHKILGSCSISNNHSSSELWVQWCPYSSDHKNILKKELKMNDKNTCCNYEEENKLLKLRIQQLEQELQGIKSLDKYEKIPYWLRPDFKPEITCSTSTISTPIYLGSTSSQTF